MGEGEQHRRWEDDENRITLGEVVRRLELRFDGLEKSLNGKLMQMQIDIDAHVNQRVYDVEKKTLVDRVGELESNQRWLVRAIIGIVIVAVMAGIGLNGGGVKLH